MLSFAAAMAIAATGLSACRTNVGVAGRVDGHGISESTVHGYLVDAGPTAKGVASLVDQAGNPVPPKNIVLNVLVESQALTRILDTTTGGVPSDATLAGLHDKAASTLLGATETGAQLDTDISKSFADDGLRVRFLAAYLRNLELEQAVIDRVSAKSVADLAKAAAAAGVAVSVNPAYGAWVAASFSVVGPNSKGSTLPNFLTLAARTGQAVAPSPAATAPSTPAGG
ncbi:MAG: hypothetical protein M3O28_00170 [Actinomycetota bacterium]|nr:hypothetical protein [Actinomycetota bacterium]